MKSILKIFGAACLFGMVGSVVAQGSYQYDNRADQYDQFVTVYQDCEFRGQSRQVSVGDYINMGAFDFNNDSISSMRVPQGMEVTLYKDDKYRGDYARVDRDIYCFDKTWNDEVSSMRVTSNNRNTNAGRYDNNGSYRSSNSQSSNNRGNNRPQYEDQRDNRVVRGENRGSDYRQNNSRFDNRVNINAQPGVKADNIANVVFARKRLQQIDESHWQMIDPRQGVSKYREVSRDNSSVYLQNDYTAERVRIDLFKNEVAFEDRNGRRSSFPISDKRAALASAKTPNISQSNSPSTRIASYCFDYKAYTNGGGGGIRFYGKDGFFQFNTKPHTDRVCHDGDLTMEIGKTTPSTQVTIEIQGRKFIFGANEKEDVLKNTWYRKKVTLVVGK